MSPASGNAGVTDCDVAIAGGGGMGGAARRLREAYDGAVLEPLRDVLAPTDVAGAYAIQQIKTRFWQGSGQSRLFYEDVGEGPAVVLAHGVGGNHASWFNEVPPHFGEEKVPGYDVSYEA